jgi:hypothetical protein
MAGKVKEIAAKHQLAGSRILNELNYVPSDLADADPCR